MEALITRFHNEDLEFESVQEEFSRMEAGLSGERRLRQISNDYSFKEDTNIFYNFECINDNGYTHQMDALICTSGYLLVVEVKQISGTLGYKPQQHESFRITEAGVQENFLNPFDQALRHQLFLESRLKLWNISLPVLYIIVIANVRAKLDNSLQNFPIFHVNGMPSLLEKLHVKYPKNSVNLGFLQKQLEHLYSPLPQDDQSIEAESVKACYVKNAALPMQ